MRSKLRSGRRAWQRPCVTRTPSSSGRRKPASRRSRSSGTSKAPAGSRPEAITWPRNACCGGSPSGRSTSGGNGSSKESSTKPLLVCDTRKSVVEPSTMRKAISEKPAKPWRRGSTRRSGPSPRRRSIARTISASTHGPKRSRTAPPRTWRPLAGTASTSRKPGAEAADFETTLVELTKSLEGNDLPSARRLVSRARHAAESARDAHFRAVMERSLQIILANAARGLDPVVARQLLKEVDDAISLGKPVDMQSLIDKRMAEADAETEARLNSRVTQARDDSVGLRQAGQNDTTALEGKLADAAIAIQERRLMHADVLLDGVEHDVFATRELLRSAAAEVLGQARGEVARARAGGIGVETANRMLKDAEASYSEARYGDTIYAGKACMSEVEELARSTADTKRKTDAEEEQAMAEHADLIRGRMEAVRAEIGNLVAQNVDLAKAVETLKAAEQAIGRGSLDEAERLVANAEGMVQGVKVTLNGQANAELRRARKAIELAAADRIEAPEFAALLERAQAALTGGRPAEVLAAVGGIDRLLAEKRQSRFQEDQRRVLEKARSAATKFITVKKLIEDLRQAEIDITGAQESLRAAEGALKERNFDDVDVILSDLDATAKELMDELVAAAKNLIDRADRKIRDGRDKKVPMEGAIALLNTAEANFAHGEYADAVEHARAAEQNVSEALKTVSEREAEARRKSQEAARAIVSDLRKTMGDLARADISILGAEQALARAEAAADAGRYADVPRELADTKEMAARLTAGLEAAAKDLVAYVAREVDDARSYGLDPGRADTVLANAREAINDHRFVERSEEH